MAVIETTIGELVPSLKAKAASITPETLPEVIDQLLELPPIKNNPIVSAALTAIKAAGTAAATAKTAASVAKKLPPTAKDVTDIIMAILSGGATAPETALNIATPPVQGSVKDTVEQVIQGAVKGLLATPIKIG